MYKWSITIINSTQYHAENAKQISILELNNGIRVTVFNVFSIICQLHHSSQFLLVEETGVPGENHRPASSH